MHGVVGNVPIVDHGEGNTNTKNTILLLVPDRSVYGVARVVWCGVVGR